METSVLDLIAGFIPAGVAPATSHAAAGSTASTIEFRTSRLTAAGTSASPKPPDNTRGSPSCMGNLHLICFSKNRAFQLDQLLQSAKRHLLGVGEVEDGEPAIMVRISVLYLVDSETKQKQSNARAHQNHPPSATTPKKQDASDSHVNDETLAATRGEHKEINLVDGAQRAENQALSIREARAETSMHDSYDLVRRRHHDVKFVEERPGEFCDQLSALVRQGGAGQGADKVVAVERESDWEREKESESTNSLVMFAVDDMFFYRDFDLHDAVRLLHNDPSIYCVHLRLHPGITWSHTAGAPCKVPPLAHTSKAKARRKTIGGTRKGHIGGGEIVNANVEAVEGDQPVADFGLLAFTREEGSGEWDYPWDLTGGLYRRAQVISVLQGVVDSYGKDAAANPNLLEFNGNRLLGRQQQPNFPSATTSPPSAFSTISPIDTAGNATATAARNVAKSAPRCACSGRAVVSSLAVNRVQTTYSTPIYAWSDERGGSVVDLDHRLWFKEEKKITRAETAEKFGGREGHMETSTGCVRRVRGESACGAEVGCCCYHGGGFDGSLYRRRAYNSVHVGELAFEGDDHDGENSTDTARGLSANGERNAESRCDGGVVDGSEGEPGINRGTVAPNTSSGGNRVSVNFSSNDKPVVTVLLPVRNGGAYLLDAVASVIACGSAQNQKNGSPLGPLELLIIDDGSDDGAVDAVMCDTATAAAAASSKIEPAGAEAGLALTDAEATSFPAASGTSDGEANVAVRVIRHDQSLGIAPSLNEGLREAKGDLVARMDADDVCMPDRLWRQVEFMLANPDVSVLGTAVAVFSGNCVRSTTTKTVSTPTQSATTRTTTKDVRCSRTTVDVSLPASRVQRIARHPTDSAFLGWSLLFGCSVAHPSVMLRRPAVLAAGGYDEAAEPAEDYELWLRMETESPGCMANMGEVLLGLRKHEGAPANVSRSRRKEQDAAALNAVAMAMSRVLDQAGRRRNVTPMQASAVRSPETTASADELAEGARLLGELEEAVLDKGRKVSVHKETEVDVDSNSERARELIRRDAEARLGAMAVHAMSRFGAGAAPVLEEWRKRYPGRPLLQALTGGGR